MRKFLIVIEKAKSNYSAYSPDLSGCVATGKTVADVEKNMYEAIQFHLQGLKDDHIAVPKPQSISEYLVVA